MIKILIDLWNFLLSCAPLLTSVAFYTLLLVLLSRSIKKHPVAYYAAFSIPFILVAVPTILRWCGMELSFSFTRMPVLGQILRDYIHMGTLGHPWLIIIMYMGALENITPGVKQLMSIRKELSIISGFPILTHSLIRVAHNFPNSLKYFTDHANYMANARVSSELGAGISNFSFVLGVVMLALFLPLWITSFDSVHRRMGAVKWKKLQRWSYVLYATLFIHAMGIQVGGMLNPRGGAPRQTDQTAMVENRPNSSDGDNRMPAERTISNRSEHSTAASVCLEPATVLHRNGREGTSCGNKYVGQPKAFTDRGLPANAHTGESDGSLQNTAQVLKEIYKTSGTPHRENRVNSITQAGCTPQEDAIKSPEGPSRSQQVVEAASPSPGISGNSTTGKESAEYQDVSSQVTPSPSEQRAEAVSVHTAMNGIRATGNDNAVSQAERPQEGGRALPKGFADIKVSQSVKSYVAIFSLILIYGSYLYLRIRKANRRAKKKSNGKQTVFK